MIKDIKQLGEAVENMHHCSARFAESISVRETHEGETVWDGVVHVFDLVDHPAAKRCYAWSHALDNSTKRRYYAVLHQGPVDSPQAAVRAAIVQEYKTSKEKGGA